MPYHLTIDLALLVFDAEFIKSIEEIYMSFKNALHTLTFLAGWAIGFNALSVSAATYDVVQTYTGAFSQTATEVDSGLGYNNILYQTTVNLTPVVLTSGDASLFSASLVTETEFLFDFATNTLSCSGVCQFTETLKSGDTIFGNILSNGATGYEWADNGIDILKIWFTGAYEITGGTGVFAGATGSGTYNGLDDYTTMTQTLTSTFSVTPVPEPESYALLLIGMSVIGFRIKKHASFIN